MINIDLNSYGKTIGDTSFIENICKEHKECIECPVMERGAIKKNRRWKNIFMFNRYYKEHTKEQW